MTKPADFRVLTQAAAPVVRFDDKLRLLAERMLLTLRAARGLGLAAPQVGVLRQVVVIDPAAPGDGGRAEPLILVNPVITEAAGETIDLWEGCLSLPGMIGEVSRRAWVSLSYQDLGGATCRLERLAASPSSLGHAAQHEIDHLHGILFTTKLTAAGGLRPAARAER
ncbi:MAG TPA: peptide deformylase [Herpetosiphonaceae bacterium]